MLDVSAQFCHRGIIFDLIEAIEHLKLELYKKVLIGLHQHPIQQRFALTLRCFREIRVECIQAAIVGVEVIQQEGEA